MAEQSKKVVLAEGTIQHPGMTTYMYGTHILVDLSGQTAYALRSSSLDLSAYVNRFVDITGKKVSGYPLEGGPVLLDVETIKERKANKR